MFVFTGQYRKRTSGREWRGREELGLFQGSPEAQLNYMHEAVGSNILESPSVEIKFRIPRVNKRHSPGGSAPPKAGPLESS